MASFERVEKVAAPHFSRVRVSPTKLRFAGRQNPQSTKTERIEDVPHRIRRGTNRLRTAAFRRTCRRSRNEVKGCGP